MIGIQGEGSGRPRRGMALLRMNLKSFQGTGAFGPHQAMWQNDTHSPGSVDRVLADNMIRLCPETADYLYTIHAGGGAICRPAGPMLEEKLQSIRALDATGRSAVRAIAQFSQSLGDRVERILMKLRFGGTERRIIDGSDWCTDVGRVACALCQVAGLPARLVYLFDPVMAYSGHVIVEVFSHGRWGAVDPIGGIVYAAADGAPASAWELKSQFGLIGIANYFVWEQHRYSFTESGINDYYRSILSLSDRGWPGGVRWLHGEENL